MRVRGQKEVHMHALVQMQFIHLRTRAAMPELRGLINQGASYVEESTASQRRMAIYGKSSAHFSRSPRSRGGRFAPGLEKPF